MTKKRKLFPIDKKRLLPKDVRVLEWLDRGGRPGGDEDFEKLLDCAVVTPPFKLKSSQTSRERSGRAKDQTV